jgi:hypothetical protein
VEDSLFIDACGKQYRAMFAMLREAVKNCPRSAWAERTDEPAFYQQALHTVVWLDIYLGESREDFKPHPGLPKGAHDLSAPPGRPPTKRKVLDYIDKIGRKCSAKLRKLDAAALQSKNPFHWAGPTLAHHMIYNLRHAQHHLGMMNSILRRKGAKPAKWICTV